MHPNEARVEKKTEQVCQTTVRNWDSQFLSCSELFFPIMPYGSVFSNYSNWPCLKELNDSKPHVITSWSGHNVQFVLQKGNRTKDGFESLYEPRIFLKGEVITRRQSWHDFYNALIWYTFPKSKAALNMRQFISFDENAEFPWKKSPSSRMREQDFMTMFDEGGCILVTCGSISLPFIFGHAVYERMILGDYNISMCGINISYDNEFLKKNLKLQIEIIDKTLSQILSNRKTYYIATPFFTIPMRFAIQYLEKFKERYK